ncbi:hypothetical protein GF338_02405, partial [candidate division WOR-3 bacterium]|nr:hypothetical protein [candidate division WOR-3 bacterium]
NLADNSVISNNIVDGEVKTADIANGAVTPGKITPSNTEGHVLTTTANGVEWQSPEPETRIQPIPSDRNLKAGFEPINEHELLLKVTEMPITSWHYRTEDPSIIHIGPMAQDFYNIFGTGDDENSYYPVDMHGVALASIQALYQQNQEKDAQIAELEKQIEAQQKALSDLETRLVALENEN